MGTLPPDPFLNIFPRTQLVKQKGRDLGNPYEVKLLYPPDHLSMHNILKNSIRLIKERYLFM
jgi:hypothetical protein